MIRVIGAGLPRTGTSSMKAALERLGFGPCYHMFEVFTHPDHVDRWLPAESGVGVDWDHVLQGYQATQDWPASHFWRQLADAYPDAKVVLTVRDPRRWYASFRSLMSHAPAITEDQVSGAARQMAVAMQRLRPMLDRIGRVTLGPDWRDGLDEDEAVAAFERHAAAVRDGLPPERLLVFDVREGWQPLCNFLGVEAPGEPFPHLNDSAALERMFQQMATEGRVTTPFDDSPDSGRHVTD